MNGEVFTEVISPAGIPRIPDEALNTRPETLEGATLGILDNNKDSPTGCWTGYVTAFGNLLKSRKSFSVASTISLNRIPEILEELNARCDAVLLGVGH